MRRSGFTLMEMIVVIFVLAAISIIITPTVASAIKGNREQEYLSAVGRLPQAAAQIARETGLRVDLVASEDGSFRLQQSGPDDAEPSVLREVASIQGIAPNRFADSDGETNAGEWALSFYPDGTSDPGGAELAASGDQWALTVDRHGRGGIASGELTSMEESRWPAGDYVRRS